MRSEYGTIDHGGSRSDYGRGIDQRYLYHSDLEGVCL